VGAPDGGSILVTTEPSALEAVRRSLSEAGYEAESAELSMEPTTTVDISDEGTAKSVLQFMERLEDLDDVQNVYANFDIPATLMERLEAQVV
jgi:transcriptional/translational regulatory protein YebC/TACO1